MTCVAKIAVFYISALLITCEVQVNCQCNSNPKVEVLYPKGLRVTLEDDGYTLFGIRGRINQPFELYGSDDDTIFDIKGIITTKQRDGKWVLRKDDVKLKFGDTLYYKLIVMMKNGKEKQTIAELKHKVQELVNEDGSPAISITTVLGQKDVFKESLIFNEEFNEKKLKTLKQWDSLVYFPAEPDYPFNMYLPQINTIFLEDDSLVLTPALTESERKVHQPADIWTGIVKAVPEWMRKLNKPADLSHWCTGKLDTFECKRNGVGIQMLPPITTAKITTRHSFNFKYGRVEVRAKLPSGNWIIPEIQLEPTNDIQGGNKHGLIRIAFAYGNDELAKDLYGGVLLYDLKTNKRTWRGQKNPEFDKWNSVYHNYTMIWKPDGLNFLVDDEAYGSISSDSFDKLASKTNDAYAPKRQKDTPVTFLDQMFHLTLGLRVGGINDFSDDLKNKPWKNSASKAMLDFWKAREDWGETWLDREMRIDYVRVYAI